MFFSGSVYCKGEELLGWGRPPGEPSTAPLGRITSPIDPILVPEYSYRGTYATPRKGLEGIVTLCRGVRGMWLTPEGGFHGMSYHH